MRRAVAGLGIWLVLTLQTAAAVEDKYKITPGEKAACTADAIRLCMGAYPDEDALLACMKANRASLSKRCMAAFDAGVRRRRL